ncbi:uncharacterized protein LOC143378807 isoform X2 [Andrena cerasifolii]
MVDPHSFYYDKHSKQMVKEINVETGSNSIKVYTDIENVKPIQETDDHSSREKIFYKRLVNMLLSNLKILAKDEVSTVGILEIEVSHSQMEILQNFQIQKISLREIDEILSNIIRKPQPDHLAGAVHIFDVLLKSFSVALEIIQQHPDSAVIVFAMIMLGLMFRMIKRGQGFPMFIVIQIIFVMSFFMTWWQLLQEAEIASIAAQMKFANVPISCQPDKMSMWDKFVSLISSNEDCEKYYQAIMSNPKLKITPAFALSHFITTVILHPITHMGTVVSVFIDNATDNLPWAYAWLVKCILYLCVGFVIIILPICISGASISVILGPLFRFGIDCRKKDKENTNDRQGNSLENVNKRDPIQIILQVPQGTSVPAIKSASSIEQPKAIQIPQNNIEEAETIIEERDCHELYDDLSCGDTRTNTVLSKSNDKNDEMCKNDGRGDG